MSSFETPVATLCASGSATLTSTMNRSITGRSGSIEDQGAWNEDSSVVGRPRSLSAAAVSCTKAAWASGSPPEKVTPPPDTSWKIASRPTSSTTSAVVMSRPSSASALRGHASTQSPHWVQAAWLMSTPVGVNVIALVGQTSWQRPEWPHRFSKCHSEMLRSSPSGFWHHRQRRGQPFRKTVVRIPGPSWTENRWRSKTRAVVTSLRSWSGR